MNSSNRLVQRVGQIMAQLANNGESLGRRLGTAFSTGLNLSIGEIQRIASSIGEKIPQPIKNGFNTALTAIQNSVNSLANKIPQPIQDAFQKQPAQLPTLLKRRLAVLVQHLARLVQKLTALLVLSATLFLAKSCQV